MADEQPSLTDRLRAAVENLRGRGHDTQPPAEKAASPAPQSPPTQSPKIEALVNTAEARQISAPLAGGQYKGDVSQGKPFTGEMPPSHTPNYQPKTMSEYRAQMQAQESPSRSTEPAASLGNKLAGADKVPPEAAKWSQVPSRDEQKTTEKTAAKPADKGKDER